MLAQFKKGTQTYSNIVLCAQKLVECAREAASFAKLQAIVWLHEASTPGYEAELRALVTSLLRDVTAATGQEKPPRFLIVQMNNHSHLPLFRESFLDQVTVASTAEHAALVGPAYFTPLCPPDDNIHTSEIGRLMLGETIAYALRSIFVENTPWSWVCPTNVRTLEHQIKIDFRLPPGCSRLSWDTDWGAPVENYGFVYSEPKALTRIVNVALDEDARTVEITLSNPPGLGGKLHYAMGQEIVLPWPSARGQLMTTSSQRSFYHRLGYPLPEYVRHYCPRFSLSVGATTTIDKNRASC